MSDADVMYSRLDNEYGIPEGFTRLQGTVQAAYLSKSIIVIVGIPFGEEDEGYDLENGHNCDVMGCGSVGPHVLAYGSLTKGGA